MLLRALCGALFCTLVAAQSDVLAFTRVPNPITDGESNVLLWQTNDTNTPISIILRQGPSTNLKTLMTLTTEGTGGQYIWKPNTSLADGTNYQLLIKQGSQNNTFGPFTVQGANPAAVSSASAASASSASAASASSASGSASSTARNATMTHRSGGNSTTMHRNTTMSHATLHHSTPKHTTATTTMTQSTTATTATVATSTSGAASPGISTSGSALALILGAVAAIFYLH